MASYTYDDFVKKAQQAGMIDQFSSYDLDLARQYPEFGLSMLSLKQNYAGANTEQARLLANEEANRLRSSYGNYTGGRDGSLYISNGLSPSSFRSGYEDALDEAVRGLSGYGEFNFTGTAPSYQNRYQEQMDSLLGEVSNPQPFDYDQATDPVWSAYKKQYRREGQRASANAMAQAAAATGGVPSSYAVTAGQQAGDYYASQLSDALPSLYEQAYNRYLQEYAQKQLQQGYAIPGWKLVEGRSTRRFTDQDAAFKAIEADGISEAMLYERSPISLTAAEKLLGRKRFAEVCGTWVEKPKGKPTLAPESDKRPAYDAAEGFEVVKE